MARKRNATKVDEYVVISDTKDETEPEYVPTWKTQKYMEEQAYCKTHNLESWQITRCKECATIVKWDDLYIHRSTVHDLPRGITQHVAYYPGHLYGQAQIVLIDPYTLNVQRGIGTEKMKEAHVYISASDKNPGIPERECSLYLRVSEARRLANELLRAADEAEKQMS